MAETSHVDLQNKVFICFRCGTEEPFETGPTAEFVAAMANFTAAHTTCEIVGKVS